MPLTSLFEITYTEAPQVDREGGMIRGVRILGRASRNGREYSNAALHQAARLYEGLGVNVNHRGRNEPSGDRAVEDGLGWLQGVEVRSDGVYGDLHYFRAHPSADLLVEAAQRNPRRFGLSHHAEGRVERKDGKLVVESIASVRSVDIVQNPATNNGLFESTAESAAVSAGEILRGTAGALAALVEDAALAEAADVPLASDCPPADNDRVPLAVQSLALNLLENNEVELIERLRQTHRVLNAHHEFCCDAGAVLPNEPASSRENADFPLVAGARSSPQELSERIDRLETQIRTRSLLETTNRACTPDRLAALAALSNDDERERLIETWPERDPHPPLRIRPAVSRPLRESRDEASRFPETAREFVAAIR